jgi:diguanylate cyclase (GGDEF)-like protein
MKKILLVSSDVLLTELTRRILSPSFHLLSFDRIDSAIDLIYNEMPDMVILDIVSGDEASVEKLHNLKDDPLFSQIPVLAIFGDGPPVATDWRRLLVEDYIRREDLERDLLMKVDLAIIRAERVVEVNPLTRLPGNISINRQIQMRLDRNEVFAFAYADLSDFKPFNDRYGFSRGDEIIKITGRLILNIVKSRQPQGSFVGHIGGDDFVFIMDDALVHDACIDILSVFDNIIPTFYDVKDRDNKGIESVDRKGVQTSFPFIGLAIGVTSTAGRRFSHFGQLTSAASEMKSLAKKKRGSSFSVDKRSDAAKPLEEARQP